MTVLAKRTKENLRIVYMGTPEFAVAPLQTLLDNQYNVVAVVTMPDKPAGRGHKLQSSPVKQSAENQNIPVLQPEKLKDPVFLAELEAYKADLFIVVAFRMLPEVVWNMPELGTFNLHASLLPQYRGAAPINWAIIRGENETGVTSFFLTHEIDTGDILLQRKMPIETTDNAGTLHDKLMLLGAETVKDTVDYILSESPKRIPQQKLAAENTLQAAPKLFKDNCRIQWDNTSEECVNFIRGLSPYPAAHTEITDAKMLLHPTKVLAASAEIEKHNLSTGTIDTDNKTYIKVATTDGWVQLHTIQIAGKKAMQTEELLRGFKLNVSEKQA